MTLSHTLMRWFFAAEVGLMIGFYFLSSDGIQAIMRSKQEYETLERQVLALKQDIHGLEREIIAWEVDPFYKEKIAREQLQMIGPNEEIYYIDHPKTV